MTFPSFYAECAYRDGQRDAASGHSNSRASYMRHGHPEPIGTHWYRLGRADAAAYRDLSEQDRAFVDATATGDGLEWLMTRGQA